MVLGQQPATLDAGARMRYAHPMRLACLLLLLALAPACSGGADEGPTCVLCTEAPPYWRACHDTEIAAGGQLVCNERGEGALCESEARCRELAGATAEEPSTRALVLLDSQPMSIALWITFLLPPPVLPAEDPFYARARAVMVERQLMARDIDDPHVLGAMKAVRRHELVPPAQRSRAYADTPLPIGHDQTISQPYVVALMTQLAQVRPGMKVLDVGTGSGYQAAVLAHIVTPEGRVYSVDIVCPLAERAEKDLGRLGYENVTVTCRDGWKGWPEHGPFDAIILAAAPAEVPPALVEQLKPGGRLVLPVGVGDQTLVVVEKQPDGTVKRTETLPVRFVPMTGGAQLR